MNNIETCDIYNNPTVSSPSTPFVIMFYQTKDSFMDIDVYKKFLDSAISRFRRSRFYTHYKHYLMNLGFDHCQFNGNLNSEMCDLELHHTLLTIYDIAIIITEHILNTVGYISTFDLVQELQKVHRCNQVAITFLSVTTHQLDHASDEFFISPEMIFGNYPKFLELYHTGITQDIAFKILFYMKRAIENEGNSIDIGLLNLRDKIIDWSGLA